jgi:ribosome-associated translation inhibitor RaiA
MVLDYLSIGCPRADECLGGNDMHIRVSSPADHLSSAEVDGIHKDLEKIDRRLHEFREVTAEVRVQPDGGIPDKHVTVELHYGRHHLVARAHHSDTRQAVRKAREELLRQINSHSRGGHSSFAKGVGR